MNIDNSQSFHWSRTEVILTIMKYVTAVLFLATIVAGDVSHIVKSADNNAPILKQSYELTPEGHYRYEYETGNGISAQEQGEIVNVGTDNAAISVRGSNDYTAPDGQRIQLAYIADENGYQPQGSHLPVPPEVPAYILRALEYIRTHPPAESNVKYPSQFH